MSEIEGGGGGSVESGGNGEVSSSSEVSETSAVETGGESSEATQEAATEEAGESGGFDEDTDTTEPPEDSAEDYEESASDEESDDSQEVGFSEEDDAENTDFPYDNADYENDEVSSGDEDGVGFDDYDDDVNDGIDEDGENETEPSDSSESDGDSQENDKDLGEAEDYSDEEPLEDSIDDVRDDGEDDDYDEDEDPGELEDYSDEEPLEDSTDDVQDDGEAQTEDTDSDADGDEADGDMDNDGEPDGTESDTETDTEDGDNIDDVQDDGEAQTEDTDSDADGDEADGDMDNDGEPDGTESDTETDTEDGDNIDDVQDDGEAQTEDTDSDADGDEADGDMDNDGEPDDAENNAETDTEDGDNIDDVQDDGETQTEDTDSDADGDEANGDIDNDGESDGTESDTETDTEDDDYDEDKDPGELEDYSDEDTDNRDDETEDDSESERDKEEEEQAVEKNQEAADRAEDETENADVENADKNVDDAAESENRNPAENGIEQQTESTDANSTNEVDTENDASRTGESNNDEAQTDISDNIEDNSTDTRDQTEEQPDDTNAKMENKADTPEGEDAYRTAMNNMAEYMSEHNYGPDDYAEYSKDPEWYKLNSELQQSLGMEVTPPTPEVAMSNMADYMNEHNYGPDDYSEYSQDPEWQKLNADLQQSLGMEVTTDISNPSPESGKDVSATELPDNCVMVNASDIDMTYAQGMDSDQFWNHHGNTKEDYMRMAERIPDVQQALDGGKSLDEIKQDPELKDTAHAYFDPENMIKVEQQADGSYSFADDGRHRIAAAQELGYEIPVDVSNAGNSVEPQGDAKTSDSPGENQNALAGGDGPDNPPPPPDGGDGPGGPPEPPEKEFGKEQLNVAAHGDDPSWIKSSDIKNKLDDIGRPDLSAKVDEAIGKLKSGDPKASENFISTMREAGNELCKNEDTADCGNALLNLVDKDEQALKVEAEDGTQEFNGLEQENNERVEGVKEITQHYYDEARTLAQNSDVGRDFTDHTEAHVEQVAEKSLETADALESAIEKGEFQIENPNADHINFVGNIDKSVLEGAALSHDTGMSGNGYALEYKVDENGKKQFIKDEDGNYIVKNEDNNNFNEVRENHSLNSAVNVLADREKYKELGYSDSQIDMMAAECMAHSKSSSGVANLNSKSDWSDCFDRVDATVAKYNEDHPDSPIAFDRTQFESNDEKLGQLATSTLALRVGDVSRDSGPEAISQSGEKVYVDRDTLNDNGGSVKEELSGADITRGENHETIDSTKSRQVHTGEQNITENHTTCDANGNVNHEITVNDGNSAPKCTQDAISDHLGEFASAKGGNFNIEVKFDSPCSPESKASYEDFRKQIEGDSKYDNITITYPWDKEE